MKQGVYEIAMGILIAIAIGVTLLTVGLIGATSRDNAAESAYREGQLDYQRGIIQYELTEDGYREYHRED